jgi:hypothetical protein
MTRRGKPWRAAVIFAVSALGLLATLVGLYADINSIFGPISTRNSDAPERQHTLPQAETHAGSTGTRPRANENSFDVPSQHVTSADWLHAVCSQVESLGSDCGCVENQFEQTVPTRFLPYLSQVPTAHQLGIGELQRLFEWSDVNEINEFRRSVHQSYERALTRC